MREVERKVKSAELRIRASFVFWWWVEDASGAVPLGFVGGASEVACRAAALMCFFEFR